MSSAKCNRARRIGLVDCNNFYASCERVFQPSWLTRPLGVLSNNDGCLVARSNELKAAGIAMGAPYFQIREQLEALNAVIVSSNYALYGDMSSRVMNTLSQFTPDLEIYSIDEAWLDLSGFDSSTLDAYGRMIVATTQRHTGIPVSLGIAETKVLAKLANRLCKKCQIPGHVFNLGSAESLDEVLATVEVQDIWGIGHRWAEQLHLLGIHSAKDLRDADPEIIRKRFSVVMERLVLELRGISCLKCEDIQPKKQIIASRSFGERVTELDALQEAVSMHASRAAEKLRSQRSVCGSLQVWIRTGHHHSSAPYYGQSAVVELATPTSDTRKLIYAARKGVGRIYRPGYRYAKAGVMLFDITTAKAIQCSLFAEGDTVKAEKLMQTVDQLNHRYGKGTIIFASMGIHPSWDMKREKITQAYTTQWHQIPVVR